MSIAVARIIETVRTLSETEREELLAALGVQKPTDQRAALVREIRGKYRHVATSVDDFLARKAEDTARESAA